MPISPAANRLKGSGLQPCGSNAEQPIGVACAITSVEEFVDGATEFVELV